MHVDAYDTGGFYDEMFDQSGHPRPEARLLLDTIASLGDGQLERCQQAAVACPMFYTSETERLQHG